VKETSVKPVGTYPYHYTLQWFILLAVAHLQTDVAIRMYGRFVAK